MVISKFVCCYQLRIPAQTDKSQRTEDHLDPNKNRGKHVRLVGIHIQPYASNKQI